MATVDNTRRSTTTHDVDTARGTSSLIDDGCAMQALSGGVSAGENATNILCRYNRRLTAEAIRQTRLQRLQALPQMSCACLDTDSALASANTSDTHTIKRTSRSFPSATGPNTHNGPCTQSAFSMDRVPHDATTPITSGECGQGECAMDGRTREDVRVHTCGMVDRQPVNLGYATQAEVLGPYSAALYVIPIDAITYTYSPASQMRPIASRMSNRLLSDPQPACHTAQEGSHVLKLSNASDMICSDVHKLDCTDKLPGVSESTSPDLHPTPDALCRIGSQHDNRHIQLPNGKLSKSSHTTAHVDTDHMRTGNGIQALRGGTKMPKELLRYICEALNVSPNVLATTATPTPTSTLSHDARATHPPPTIPKATNLAGAGVPSCVPGRHWDQVSAQHAPHEDGKGCGQGQTDCGGLLEQLRHMYDAAITVAWEVQTGTQATRAGMCTPVHPLHACAVSQGTGVSTTRECRGNSVCYSPARSGSKGSGVASALNNIPESEACAYREQEMLSKPTGDSCSAHEAERRRDGTAALSPSQKPPVSAAHLRESVRRGTKTPPASLDSYQPAQRTSSSGPAMGKATSTPVLTTRRSNENGMAVVASRLSASVSSPTKIGTSGCHGNGNGNGRERGTFIQRLFGGLFSSSSSSKNSIQSQSLTLQTNFNSNTNIAPTLDDLAATLSTPPCSIPTNTNAIAQFQLNHESFSRNSSPSTSLPTTPNWLNPFSRITGSPTSTAHALTGYSSDGDYSGDYGNGRVLALGPAGRTEIRRKTLILVTTPELHVLPWEQILGDDSCMRLLSVVSSSPSVSSSTDDCHGYTGKTSFHSPTPGRGTIVTFFSSENEDEAVLQAHRLHNSARSLAHHLTGASAAGQRHAQHTTSTCRATAEPLQQCLCEADCDSLDHMACTHIPSACRRKHEHTAPTATTATGAQPPLTTGSTVPSTTGPSQTSPKHPPTEPPLQLSTCWCLRHGDRHTSAADPFPSLVAVGKKVSRYRRAYSKDVKFVDTSEGASAGLPYLTRAVDGVIVAGRLNVLVLTTADMTSATNGLMCVQTLSRTAGSVSADAKPLVTVVVPAHLVKETIRVLLKHKQTKRGQSFLAHLISSVAKIREKHMTSIAVFGVPVGPT
ncbi:hypothetical protein SARC_09666 [Sphaeroforma arctica JP610]|uniref:Uncharacterized protein n=1 Tax=Sphaeroforma arctica JP610 TaxID=667725 RepID=A0A0L0FMA5_9EUKA|nr:hypothetical protein SARC_09666 [Sphaeroforma arctica JP610]KNC77885.1 hypothetical protein SARC_09666 [Sphaeroforma arctica JP610]|eukprot:XP_014151787.1 hypothetical protein SARC_09666 [Sphaeroforma arctica JP610]